MKCFGLHLEVTEWYERISIDLCMLESFRFSRMIHLFACKSIEVQMRPTCIGLKWRTLILPIVTFEILNGCKCTILNNQLFTLKAVNPYAIKVYLECALSLHCKGLQSGFQLITHEICKINKGMLDFFSTI